MYIDIHMNMSIEYINYDSSSYNEDLQDTYDNNDYYDYKEQNEPLFTHDDILKKLNVIMQNGQIYKNNLETQNNTFINKKQPFLQTKQGQTEKWQVIKQSPETQQVFEKMNNSGQSNDNSYIYNKYFKNKSQQSQKTEIQILRPKNIQEYKKMLLQQAIEKHNKRVYLNNVKSKKLQFGIDTNPQIQKIQLNNGQSQNNIFGLKK